MIKSKKIPLDKYYTSQELAEYVVKKTKEIIGEDNITEYLEPSAGAGVFLNYLSGNVLAYDIDPADARITKQDFLKLELDYKEGRCVIGNPPYGTRNTTSVSFFKKSITLCDFIVFILPISQYKNSQQMYEFDLIFSEDFGKRIYSDKHIHCCLNVYKRNKNGLHKNPPNYRLEDIEVLEYRRNGTYKKPKQYDFGMCSWGSGIGKEVQYVGEYAQENYIVIKNEDFRDEILFVMRNTNWKYLYSFTSSPKIQTWKIYKYLKEQLPELR